MVAIDDEKEIEKLLDLDAIADTVSGPTIQRLMKAIRAGDALGVPEGADKYYNKVEAFMAQPDASRLYQLADDVARGKFTIPIARTMRLSEIEQGHRLAESHGTNGKIILVP